MKRALIVAFAVLLVAAANVEKRTVISRGKNRTYALFVPDAVDAGQPLPLVITLHGSGGNGAAMVDLWKGLAQQEKIIVAGPYSIHSMQWALPDDGPQLFYDVVEDLRRTYAIDTRRIYVFGHSAGACFALQMGLAESEYFAAAFAYAGSLTPDTYAWTRFAARRIPFALLVGTRDRFFSVGVVRATRDVLAKEGFPVELTEVPNQTHEYYRRSGMINAAAWKFFRQQSLSVAPSYTEYTEP